MKGKKEAQRIARQLLKATLKDGVVDESVVKIVSKKLIEKKPRGYVDLLSAYARLIRIELSKSHAVIESAVTLSDAERSKVESDMRSKYGNHLTTEFSVDEELLGGMRVRVGNDVWDGSVRNRIDRLREKFN